MVESLSNVLDPCLYSSDAVITTAYDGLFTTLVLPLKVELDSGA